MNTYEKEDDNTLKVTETVPAEVLPPKTYNYGFLKQQLIDIQARKDSDDTLRDAELAEVNLLISEADKLGISEEKPVEPAPVEPQ